MRLFQWALMSVSLVLSLAGSKLQAQPEPKKVALLVGVNRYDKRGFAEKPLQFAERDVDELAVLLKKQNYDVRVLKGSSSGTSRATKANIDAAVNAVLSGRNERDVVLLAFAGHGQQMPLLDRNGGEKRDENGKTLEDAYFCPADAERQNATSLISLTQLMQTLDTKGGVNLVMVDACRDNPDPGRGRSISGNELNGRLPSNTAVLFSCSAGQEALETDKAGGGHGVFFHHVLEGLQGAAADPQGNVSWSRLSLYVTEQVNPRAKEWLPERADYQARRNNVDLASLSLQTPHELRNMTRIPILARIDDDAPEPLLTNTIGMKLKLIPAGSFQMGSPADEEGRDEDEHQHLVRITKPFYLGIHEVTVGQFRRFETATGHRTEAETDGEGGWGWNDSTEKFEGRDVKYNWRSTGFAQTDNHPVVNVTWNDAVKFCEWLTRTEGTEYRLPSEAEWEYVCRAGSSRRYSFGDSEGELTRHANVFDATAKGNLKNYQNSTFASGRDGFVFTAPVGSLKANEFGIYDMHGNVYEWCSDWYDSKYYKASSTVDPRGPSTGSLRVYRGGGWRDSAQYARSADRYGDSPDFRDCSMGFRVLRSSVLSGK